MHPSSTVTTWPYLPSGSDWAPPRHTRVLAYGCFLPDLTRFASSRCAGLNPQHLQTNRHQTGKASKGIRPRVWRISGTGNRQLPA